MSITEQLDPFVKKRPLLLLRLNKAASTSLRDLHKVVPASLREVEYIEIKKFFTHSEPHDFFCKFKAPAICLIEFNFDEKTECHMGIITRKAAHSTLNTRLSIDLFHRIHPDSLFKINKKVRSQHERMPKIRNLSSLSYESSVYFLQAIEDVKENAPDGSMITPNTKAMNAVLDFFTKNYGKNHYLQNQALNTAFAVFDIKRRDIPEIRVLEDNAIQQDMYTTLPGFKKIKKDITGYVTYKKGQERITIYMANKNPLEEMLGVDLIYINEIMGNMVMIQYKMLERPNKKWVFRIDDQLMKEMSRMNIRPFLMTEMEQIIQMKPLEFADYRLNSNPFFFQFVKRFIKEGSENSDATNFIISLEHFNEILLSPQGRGPRGGQRIDYEVLEGRYLRKTNLIDLIRYGYIGTYRVATDVLEDVIACAAKKGDAVVVAWAQRI